MPWILTKTFRFEAAHHLPWHDGKCQRVHGHSWVLGIECTAPTLQSDGPQVGMVLDYGAISAVVRPFVEQYLDHWDLNTTTGLANPTSEILAAWIFRRLKPSLLALTAVSLDETCTSACTFRPGAEVS